MVRADEDVRVRPQLFVLTQWNSNALNQHIHLSFPPTTFGTAQARGFVDVLTANQTPRSTSWCVLQTSGDIPCFQIRGSGPGHVSAICADSSSIFCTSRTLTIQKRCRI